MNSLRRLVAAVFLCLGIAGAWASHARADGTAYPALLPRSILALRGGQADTTQLQVVFDRTEDGHAATPLIVWIGPDYFALVDGGRVTITDLRLRRRLIVDRQAGTLVNLSLYGDIMLRRIELARRLGIAQELTKQAEKDKSTALPQSLDRFWIESELGIAAPGAVTPPIEQRQEGDAAHFIHDGETVATIVPSDQAIPVQVARGWAAFVHHTWPLHPRIAGWLALSRVVPARLDFVNEAKGDAEQVGLRLHQIAAISAEYPLPPQLSLLLLPGGAGDPEVTLARQVLPHMLDAVAERESDRADRLASFHADIDRAFTDGRKFEAALGLTEMALRWGKSATDCDSGGTCRSKEEIDDLLRHDTRSTIMFEATVAQGREPERAIQLWRDIDRGDVPNGYVVDFFLARLLSERGERVAASQAFVAAFNGDPFIPALYRDLGDHFVRVTRLDLAWLCYDLGRALPNRREPDALSAIDTLEEDLVQAYPELF